MKKKELKELAKKIAKYELTLQSSDDPKVIKAAQDEIMKLSSHVESLDDITLIDEYVQEEISKNS